MKPIIRYSLLLFAIPFMVTAAPTPDIKPVDFSGTWKNQRNSVLILKKENSGHYTGTFATAVAQTKSCIGKKVPLKAISNKNALSISLSMQPCGSDAALAITALWNKDSSGKEAIDTMSLTVWSGREGWDSRIVTHDSYHKISQ